MKLVKTHNLRFLLLCYVTLKLADGLKNYGADRQYQMNTQLGCISSISTLKKLRFFLAPLGYE